jgi:hypothetical protein
MNYFKMNHIRNTSIILAAIFLTNIAHAQKYKTMADTTRLNKEYGEISLEASKLTTQLIEEKNKTVDYRSKTSSTTGDAINTAEASKNQAAVATSGNTTDTKKAVKDAKEADRKANDEKHAMADEKKNIKKINELTAQIDQKQRLLRDLDSQRAAIMGGAVPAAVIDSAHTQ